MKAEIDAGEIAIIERGTHPMFECRGKQFRMSAVEFFRARQKHLTVEERLDISRRSELFDRAILDAAPWIVKKRISGMSAHERLAFFTSVEQSE